MAHIIIIEDNLSNLEFMCHLLGASGHHVTTVADDDSGLELIRWAAPELIIYSGYATEVGGYELARLLKTEPGLSHIPRLAVMYEKTVGDGTGPQVKNFDDYIDTPIEAEIFVLKVKTILNLERHETASKPPGIGQSPTSRDAEPQGA